MQANTERVRDIITEQLYRFTIPAGVSKILEIDETIIVISHYQIMCLRLRECIGEKSNWKWEVHPFTTQMIGSEVI